MLTDAAHHIVSDSTPAAASAAARRATQSMFLICGTAMSCWAPMVPFAKARLNLDEATLGTVLLALGAGSMVAMPLAGVAIHRWGSRPVLAVASVVSCAVLPWLALPSTTVLLATTLFVFGAALGALDVAMNAHGIVVQRLMGRPIMSGFHALFSVGGLLGAAAVAALLRAGVSLAAGVFSIAIALALLALVEQRHLLSGHREEAGATFTIVPKPALLLLGVLCFISFLAEGAVLDWSAVFLREIRMVDVSLAGAGYGIFSVAMAAGRFTGDRMTHRVGSKRVLRIGGGIAALGFFIVAVLPSAAGALLGFVLIGVGASNVVPVLFSASGRVPGVPAGIALATVTTIGYAGLLLGPALVGFLAQTTSLPVAFAVLASMFALVALGANSVRE
jgi:predicted MFS family arabinose efflux permease